MPPGPGGPGERGERTIKRVDAFSWGAVDVHCHILPGLDDGPGELARSVAMLRLAASEGITDMIATPHFHQGRYTASPETVLRAMWRVQRAADAARIPIQIYPGNEIYYFDDMLPSLKGQGICTMNGTDMVLVEFSPAVLYRTMQNALDRISSEGYQPILAHAERYECLLKDMDGVFFLHDSGVHIQVNAGTVTGKSGAEAKRFAHRLLEEHTVDYIGTDAHGCSHRAPEMAQCRKIIEKKYGGEYAYQVMRGNAEKFLDL